MQSVRHPGFFVQIPKQALHQLAAARSAAAPDHPADLLRISIGPDLFDIHTPKERLDLKSAERTMKFVLKILETV